VKKYGVTKSEVEEVFADIEQLKKDEKLFTEDIYEPGLLT
jgi:hypothetical protein